HSGEISPHKRTENHKTPTNNKEYAFDKNKTRRRNNIPTQIRLFLQDRFLEVCPHDAHDAGDTAQAEKYIDDKFQSCCDLEIAEHRDGDKEDDGVEDDV
ncbi:MAG: hypothetical protein Q9170_008080, partial [Blastenia crenularia]